MHTFSQSALCTIVASATVVFFTIPQARSQDLLKGKTDTLSSSISTQKSSVGFLRSLTDTNSHFLYRRLYGLFVRESGKKDGVMERHSSIERFEKFAGKVIAEVQFIRLKSFGQSVHNPSAEPEKFAEKLGNVFHATTIKPVIAHNILFKKNDLLKPVDLVESEQILRDRPYIEDAIIVVEPIEGSDKVIATVITKDKFTLALDLDLRTPDLWDVEVSEAGFFGMGIKVLGSIYHNAERDEPYGYKVGMKVDNIWGSFISTDMYYRRGVSHDVRYVNFNRDFYASKTRVAGGFTHINRDQLYGVVMIDSTIRTSQTLNEGWLGYSFRFSGLNPLKPPYLLTVAAKIRNSQFHKSLPTTALLNPYFNSNKHYLISVGLSRQSLYQTNLVYLFGSTEDIPVGFKMQMATGFEEDAFQRRYLVNGEIAAAQFFRVGYLFGSARIGGYLTAENKMQQASLNLRSTYISNLMSFARHDLRSFVSFSYTRGISRFMGEREYIVLGNGAGIRGLSSCELLGTTRIFLNVETMAYSPFHIYGFRLAYFAFCDMGMIGFKQEKFMENLYSGIGLGLRIRNESLVFPTFILRLAYYPNAPADARLSHFYLTSESKRYFEQFRAREPQLLPYE